MEEAGLTEEVKEGGRTVEQALIKEQRLAETARLGRERTTEQAHTAELSTDLSSEARRAKEEALAKVDSKAMQDFFDVARDQGLWKRTDMEEGELSRTFNEEAGFEQGPQDSGDNDDGLAPDRSTGFDDNGGDDDSGGPRHRRGRGKGYGYRRGSE